MQAELLFWGIAGGLVLAAVLVVFAPILRGGSRAERRASYDMQVYRDQLRETGADVARGVVTEAEAQGIRVEISRRLLAAADAEETETPAAAAPRRLSGWAAPGLMALVLAGAAGLYGALGAPGVPDLPLGERLARLAQARAERPGQDEVETLVAEATRSAPAAPAVESPPENLALVTQLQEVLARRPDDVEGHKLLARSLGALERWPQARAAQQRAVDLLGEAAEAADLVTLAELMILAANGYVSPEAESALGRALASAPSNPLGRYYSGLTLLQGGRPDLTHRLWSGLLDEGPPDAPWIAAIEAEIDAVARLAGLPPRDAARSPTRVETQAAEEMTPQERAAMIEGMVGQLAERLGAEGGPPEEWARLIRALGVLGRVADAADVWNEARAAYAGTPAALDALTAAARDAGLVN